MIRPRPEYEPRDYLMDSINKEIYAKDVRIWELEMVRDIVIDERDALRLEVQKLLQMLKEKGES